MASIIKRKTKYSVVYTYTDSNGAKRQKWETCGSHAEAKKRNAEIEHQLDTGVFIPPSADTLSDFLDEYVSLYGVNTWAPSTFDGHTALISNYIKPIIGDVKLDDISPRMITKFYKDLQTVKAVPRYGQPEGELISPNTIREIHKLLRNAFNQAVKWELMARNPVQNATVPKAEKHERNIWDAQTLMKALSLCDDPFLALAINLAFACSLRMGELLGLTWSCVDISQDSIDHDCAYIYIDKELQRISRESLAQIGEKGIMFKFPTMRGCNSTVLALKEPKTKTSVRKVFLPRAVAEMLVERRKTIEELKELVESGDDANKSYTEFKKLQQQWNDTKLVPQGKVNELWKNYQLYVENFYDLLKLNNEFREYDFKKNLEIKTHLCEAAEKLADEEDVVAAFHQLQKLHQEFRDTGPVAKELRDEIWNRFKAASTAVNRRH